MQTQIESFPQFVNPFTTRATVDMTVAADGNAGPQLHKPSAVVNNDAANNTPGCTASANPTADWWNCLNSQDGPLSYDETNATKPQFNVTMSTIYGADLTSPVWNLFVVAQCRAYGGGIAQMKVDFGFGNGVTFFEFAQYLTCYPGAFANQTLSQDFTAKPLRTLAAYSQSQVTIIPQAPPFTVDISFLRVRLTFSDPECTAPVDIVTATGYIGCQIGAFFRLAIKGFVFLVNGLVFIGSVIAWFVSLVGIFFGSLFALFGAQGAPPLVSGLVGILVIGLILYVAIVMMGKIRGTGNLG